MKKLFLVAVVLALSQTCVYAQLGLSSTSRSGSENSRFFTNGLNVNLDSLILDSLLLQYKTSQSIPGIATLILKDNGIIWNKNYGYANIAQQREVTDTTLFYLASISKTFVATAVLQLWERGLIDLNRNINHYLPAEMTVVNPYFPSDSITSKMILTHSSSIQDNWPYLDAVTTCGDSPMCLDTFLVRYFTPGRTYYSSDNFYNVRPAAQYHYSNVAVCLLVLVVETITGRSFEEYCADSIFTPLRMSATSWHQAGMDASNIATPYYANSANCHEGNAWYPAVDLRTNKLELSHYLLAYINGGRSGDFRLLDSATVEYMLSDQLGYLADGTSVQGLIWFLYPFTSGGLWGHNGARSRGAETYVGFDPSKKIGVIILQNSCETSVPYVHIAGIANILNSYAQVHGNIYAVRSVVPQPYAIKGIDSVLFQTTFSNVSNHQFTARLIYCSSDSSILDSLQLSDDGTHGDPFPNDGVFGACVPPQQGEDFYSLSVSTVDQATGKYFCTPDIATFTTAGPLVIDSVAISKQGAYNYWAVRVYVRNDGLTSTITGASISCECSDPWMNKINTRTLSLPSISPGAEVYPSTAFIISYDPSTFPGHFNLKFKLAVNGFVFWTKTLTGVASRLQLPTVYVLNQNYPNPFNPTTAISYKLPAVSFVTLKVYDVLGREVVTLVNAKQSPGTYAVQFDGSKLASGVYFYRIKAGGYTAGKKMLLLK